MKLRAGGASSGKERLSDDVLRVGVALYITAERRPVTGVLEQMGNALHRCSFSGFSKL